MRAEFPDAGDVMHSLLSWLERHGFYALDYTSVCCPQQLSGRTKEGMLFYYRFRRGGGFLVADWRANDLDELITMHLHGEVQIEIELFGDSGHDGWEPLDALTSAFYLLMAKSSVGAKDEQ